MLKAVIDLGTNTFQLVIANVANDKIDIVDSLQIPVKIGKGGINNGLIIQDALKRATDALAKMNEIILKHRVKKVKAIATSAIRNAKNANDFIQAIKDKFNIQITTITGDLEAQLIYEGVVQSLPPKFGNFIVVDIGGGSVEFILGNAEKVFYKQSFEIGAARLLDKFHHSDPITLDEISAIHAYLNFTLQPLKNKLSLYPVDTMVGSAGSFETLVDVVEQHFLKACFKVTPHLHCIAVEDLTRFVVLMQQLSKAEIANVKGMTGFRVEMISVASVIMQFITETFQIRKIYTSEFSLREGVLMHQGF